MMLKSKQLTRAVDIKAEILNLEAEREEAMMRESVNTIVKIKTNNKVYEFKTANFEAIIKTHVHIVAARLKCGSKYTN
jgi:hypothetical protein